MSVENVTVLRVDRLWGEDNCRFRRNTCPLIAFLMTRNGKKRFPWLRFLFIKKTVILI